MYKSATSGKLQPSHKALNTRPQHKPFRKDRRPRNYRTSGRSSPQRKQGPSRPELRKQILRIATESFEAAQEDHQGEDPHQPESGAVPAPTTPPFPPPAVVITEQPNELQDVIAMVDSLRNAMIESHEKLESLLQKTATVLTTQHEAMTAMIASCKQQLDILESLLRQGTPDWS